MDALSIGMLLETPRGAAPISRESLIFLLGPVKRKSSRDRRELSPVFQGAPSAVGVLGRNALVTLEMLRAVRQNDLEDL